MKKNYPLNKHTEFTNMKDLIDTQAANIPDKTAFRYMNNKKDVTVTYRKFRQDIDALGTYFYKEGLRGKHIAIIGENSYEWIVSYFAAVFGSNITVPIDKELSDNEILSLLKQGQADVLVFSNSYKDIAEQALSDNIVTKIFNMRNFDFFKKKGENLLKEGNADFINNHTDENAVCSIIFTSGTTGTPKGVMLSQRSLMADTVGSCNNVFIAGATLLTLPLHHAFPVMAGVLAMILYGVPICISKSLRTFAQDMLWYKPQNIFIVPLYAQTMYKQIWQKAKEQGKDKQLKTLIKFSNLLRKCGIDLRRKLFKSVHAAFGGNLDLLVSGGALMEQKYIDGFDDIGITLLNGYGITECSPVTAVNRNKLSRKNSVGLPLPCNEIKIIDGEICIKGSNVMLGYYNDEAATEEAFCDGWFKTGDLGYLDEDGFLYITGRRKNLIILSNGENVSPEELEALILDIPNVTEVLVYAENNVITAEIFAEDKSGIQDKITELNKELPLYKKIQKVKFRNTEFEKTATKKIKREMHNV